MTPPRLTLQTQMVLQALLVEPDRELYGLQIVESTGLPPGTIYPILARLEAAGWLSSRWEEIDQHAEKRPRRRYYQLTAASGAATNAVDGVRLAAEALNRAEERRRGRSRQAAQPGPNAKPSTATRIGSAVAGPLVAGGSW